MAELSKQELGCYWKSPVKWSGEERAPLEKKQKEGLGYVSEARPQPG